jgi:type IV pilus biogenesis protein CpaD/CtpE
MSTSYLRQGVVALSATALLLLAGCGGEDASGSTPTDTASQSDQATAKADTQIDVTIKGEDVTPVAQAVQLEVGQTLQINLTSDRSGELHVHSSPEQSFEFEAGTSQFRVTLDKPGSVDIEEHVSDALVVRVLVQ